jgi:hypothetical protein
MLFCANHMLISGDWTRVDPSCRSHAGRQTLHDKGKPSASWGRKATGPNRVSRDTEQGVGRHARVRELRFRHDSRRASSASVGTSSTGPYASCVEFAVASVLAVA